MDDDELFYSDMDTDSWEEVDDDELYYKDVDNEDRDLEYVILDEMSHDTPNNASNPGCLGVFLLIAVFIACLV